MLGSWGLRKSHQARPEVDFKRSACEAFKKGMGLHSSHITARTCATSHKQNRSMKWETKQQSTRLQLYEMYSTSKLGW
jgi:preprotein translocase subunit SecA